MYDPISNPSTLYDGLFVCFYLLSDTRLSAIAKLLYVYLAGQANGRGEVIPDVPFTARILGTDEYNVYKALNELEQTKYFTTRRNRIGTQFVHCRFVPPPWLKIQEPEFDPTVIVSPHQPASIREKSRNFTAEQAVEAVVEFPSERKGGRRRRGRRSERSRSMHPYEACLGWARHCEKRGDHFPRGVEYFAGWLWKFGAQDDDITKWLERHPEGQKLALKFAGQKSGAKAS